MTDLLELLAARAKDGKTTSTQSTAAQEPPPTRNAPHPNYLPTVSSELLSPPASGAQLRPRHSGAMSFNATTASDTPANDPPTSDKASNLLNLLKFNQQNPRPDASTGHRASSESVPKRHARDISASDFSPSFPGQSALPARQHSFGSGNPSHNKNASSDNHQNMLLNLLKHPETGTGTKSGSSPAMRPERPSPSFGKSNDGKPIPFQPSTARTTGSELAYNNPFDRSYSPSHRPSHNPQNLPENTGVKSQRLSQNVSPIPSSFSKNDWGKPEKTHAGTGAEHDKRESVSDALQEVASTADKEARKVLKATGAERQGSPGPGANNAKEESSQQEIKEAVHDAAVELRDELEDGKTKTELERDVSKPVASAIQETAGMIAQGTAGDNWENSEADKEVPEGDQPLKVYSYPMRPWVSIDVKISQAPPRGVRKDIVMKIATLKKGFDQSDRNLVSASPTFIVYTMTKGGGFRIIRQDDGANKTMFRNGENQIFSVSLSAPISSHHSAEFETVVAIGKDGAVYWTQIPLDRNTFDDGDLEKYGFILPPLPNSEENTSTGQVKTRAKMSSRHPEFFALSRGKTVHIVPAFTATLSPYADPKSRSVDTKRFFNDHNLKIATGKAAKDFTFSGDDTVIVSLDKRGKIQFWDITAHIEKLEDTPVNGFCFVESKTPIITHWASQPNRKPWPTSVQLVDKEKPTIKAAALRYMLVGLNQNHTLQLWDLSLGKAVQELNLPHQNEADPVCTITYHSRSGIIIIGHPTRNSLYLIHLSAPRYNLPPLSQASFLHCLVRKSEALPRPESTAIMSGMRELSLNSVGEIRSFDILPSPPEKEDDEETIFELYVMQSRGVTCLRMKRQDLGWNQDGRVIDNHNALEEGMISIKDLHQAASNEGDDNSIKTDDNVSKLNTKAQKAEASGLNRDTNGSRPKSSQVNGTEKSDKKKQKKKGAKDESEDVVTHAQPKATETHGDIAPNDTWGAPELPQDPKGFEDTEKKLEAALGKPKGLPETKNQPPSYQLDTPQYDSNVQSLPDILDGQFRHLYRRIDDERRAFDAASSAKYESILRLVASTLTENVDKSLSQIITSKVQESVLPSISQDVSKAFEQQLSGPMSKQLDKAVPREIKAASEGAFAKAVQDPNTLRKISESVSSKLTTHVEKEFSSALKSVIMPAFKDVATQSAKQAVSEMQGKMNEQLNLAEKHRANDSGKIDNLAKLVEELTSNVKTMAGAQTGFQNEILNLRSQLSDPKPSTEPESSLAPVKAEGDGERDSIKRLMAERKWEEATVQWLQSGRQSELFEEVLVHQPPQYLRMLSPIVALSVAASLTLTFESYVMERLMWLEIILGNTDSQDPDVAEYVPGVMERLNERLMDTFMKTSAENPGDPNLIRIHTLVRQVKQLRDNAR